MDRASSITTICSSRTRSFEVVKCLQTNPDADLIYSDEDKLTEEGLGAPLFKPDWSPDFFLSYNYLCHFTTIRREIVEKAAAFPLGIRWRAGLRSLSSRQRADDAHSSSPAHSLSLAAQRNLHLATISVENRRRSKPAGVRSKVISSDAASAAMSRSTGTRTASG